MSAAAVRDFNRYYTRQLGLLTDSYLGQRRPFGEARLLFEIGESGAAVAGLRERLGLDSGYLSRLLGSLRRQGLIIEAPDPADARAKHVELTPAGRDEVRELDARSEAGVATTLAALTSRQQADLLSAMTKVERLLRAAGVTITPASLLEATPALSRYVAELQARFPEGYDCDELVTAADITPPDGVMLLARDEGEAIGCAALRRLADGVGEVRHMWVQVEYRRLGIANRLLAAIEEYATNVGVRELRLGTHDALPEAMALYERAGWSDAPAYRDDPYGHRHFAKQLVP